MVELNYDDNGIDIVEKLNKALVAYGLVFNFDDEEHDGFEVVTLDEIEEPKHKFIKFRNDDICKECGKHVTEDIHRID